MLFNTIFFYITILFYGVSAIFFILYALKDKEAVSFYSHQWLMVSVLSGAFSFILRYKEGGHLPLATLYEITFFYAWMISLLQAIFIKKDMPKAVHLITFAIAAILYFSNIFMDQMIHPLNPQLKSYWFAIHVPVAMLSYGAFALSFAISIYYLFASSKGKELKRIVKLNYGLISIGAFLLGVCIVTGGIWAVSAWGQFWSWDPKETWALITFIIYAGAALAGGVFKIDPKWQAWISIAGFCAMLLTFFGVSLWMASHHAY